MKHLMSKTIATKARPNYKAWVKGTMGESGPPRYSANWATARRAWFKVYPDRIECGDWIIPASAVEEAVLFETKQWCIPVYILAIKTSEKTWQFGFNPWTRIASYLPFDFRREHVRLRYSRFSLLIRSLFVVYIVYSLWRQWHAG